MDNETVQYTPKSARLAGEYLFGGLVSFGILVFSLLISGDCYFNAVTLGVSIAAVVASLVLLIVAVSWGQRLALRDGVPAGKTAATPYVLLAMYSPIIVYATLSLLVFLTSREPVQVSTRIYAGGGSGRGCRMYYQFYNAPTGRTLSVCHDKFLWAAKSGDGVIVIEKTGPLGARIQSFNRDPNSPPESRQ
jgi:hypothetical protein